MTTSTLRIALPKLFLWTESGRIQEYPEAASRAEPGRVYSRVDLELDVFDIAATMEFKGGAPRGQRTDGVINTYGLERSGERYRINGINLFNKVGKGLQVTSEGIELGRAFREAETDSEWARQLACQILKREPRTRLIIWLCLRGWKLGVEAPGGIPTGKLFLTSPEGDSLEVTKRNCDGFNQLLGENAELALGPSWRSDLLALGELGAVTWEGVQGGTPSTSDLPTALKKALTVFFHLGAFEGESGTWELDAGGLADALALDDLDPLGFECSTPLRLTDDEAFARSIRETAGVDGYIIVSQLADRFGELLNVPADDRSAVLDSYIRTAMYHDHLRVVERHPGQPRMGRGLFGESSSRSIRLDFTPSDNSLHIRTADHTPAATSSQMQGEKK